MHTFSLSASDAASIGKGCTEGEATQTCARQQTERAAKEVFFNTLQAWLCRENPAEMMGKRLFQVKYVSGIWITDPKDRHWDRDDDSIFGHIKKNSIKMDHVTEAYGFTVLYRVWSYGGGYGGVPANSWEEMGHVTGFPEDFYIVGHEPLLEDCVSTLTSKGFVVKRCSTGRLNVRNPYLLNVG